MAAFKKNALNLELKRSITGSLGRFIAIIGIVALGCGFFAGLRMTGIGMRKAADAFYGGTNLYDIEVVSTLGLSDANVDELAAINGVSAVMPAKSVDVMASFGEEQYSCRISTLPLDAAAAATVTSNGATITSSDENYLNRVSLQVGSWPTTAYECVLSYDRAMHEKVELGDTVRVLYGTSSLDAVLAVREFTVVGFVSSSYYTNVTTLATTTLGNGTLAQFMYVGEDAFSADCPYTEVYLKVAGASELLSGSDAYYQKVDEVEDVITSDLDALALDRRNELVTTAQIELASKRAEFEDERAKAYAELDDAQAQLDSAKAQLDEAKTTLASSYDELVAGQAAYEQGVTQAADGRKQANEQFAAAEAQIAAQEQELASGEATLAQKEQELAAGWAAYKAALAQAGLSESDAEALFAAMNTGGASSGAASGQALAATGDSSGNQAALAQLAAMKAQLDEAQEQVDAAKAELASGKAQLAAAKEQLASEKAAAYAKLDAADAQLVASKKQLDAGWTAYYEGVDEYNEGLSSYESGVAELAASSARAEEELASAQAKLDDAQQEIDDIATPELYVLDREQNYGAESYQQDSKRIDSIATVFPFFFFVVAALVALTTMTRMVEDERGQIGTLKALGYTTAQISKKYVIYALLASVLGGVLGIGIMSQLLPWVIQAAYGIMYNVPARPFPLPVEPVQALQAMALGVGVTLFATAAACAATLRETPSTLMQPKAPAPGKRILLERITPVWKRLSFSWKVTLRNIFRYKRRFFMTVIGIAGCTGLLVTGLGIRDAISDIIDLQFGEVWHFDTQIGLAAAATEDEVSNVVAYLDSTGAVGTIAEAHTLNMLATSTQDAASTHGVQVIQPVDTAAFEELVTLRERVGHAAVALDASSVLLSEKLATQLGVGVGDTVCLYAQDAVGNATGTPATFTVTGIVENYLGDLVYMGTNSFASLPDAASAAKTLYAQVATDEAVRSDLASELATMPDVDTVVFNDESIATYREMLSSVDMVMGVLVVAAAALAFVVLYNMANINIEERKREIASLKVLGFTRREVFEYVFREILIIVIVGALLGLVLGYFFEGYVVVTAEVSRVMFGRTIHTMSYVYSFALTMVFSVLVMFAMRPKLNHINMVESLKSVE
jgi:putative ABC transport system permease protein